MNELIFARMEAVIRRLAGDWTFMPDGGTFRNEAIALQRLIEVERDPDIADAERIANGFCGGANVQAVLDGIKHGREAATRSAS